MSAWAEVETFSGDKSYESPVLTFDGAITVYLNPSDAESAAITLRVASGLRESASVHLTTEETRDLSRWLLRSAEEMEREALA